MNTIWSIIGAVFLLLLSLLGIQTKRVREAKGEGKAAKADTAKAEKKQRLQRLASKWQLRRSRILSRLSRSIQCKKQKSGRLKMKTLKFIIPLLIISTMAISGCKTVPVQDPQIPLYSDIVPMPERPVLEKDT